MPDKTLADYRLNTKFAGGNGKSAYEVATLNGFVGTEAQWVASLKGKDGIKGEKGNDGHTPIKGVDYFDGLPGQQGLKGDTGERGLPGNDGAQGIQGLKGDTGAKGDTGNQGIQGLQGNPGVNGIGFGNTSATTPATSGTMTVNMTTDVITITPTGACTFNGSGGVTGNLVTFHITTSGTSSYTLTFGTNFRKTGTLATGTTNARFFSVTFRCINGTIWSEICRTAAQT